MGQAVFDFSGTTTVITGGASGIGLTCAELIAKCGGDVVVSASRRPDKTEKALDRLEALQEYADLGAGYQIALKDLEIRGAGNILGKEQAGAINRIGLNLYCQMLSEAIEELRSAG